VKWETDQNLLSLYLTKQNAMKKLADDIDSPPFHGAKQTIATKSLIRSLPIIKCRKLDSLKHALTQAKTDTSKIALNGQTVVQSIHVQISLIPYFLYWLSRY